MMEQSQKNSLWKIVTIFLMMAFLYGGMSYYVGMKVFRWLLIIFPNMNGTIYSVIYMVLALSMLLGYMPIPLVIKKVMRYVGAYWMGFFVYWLILFFILDALRIGINLVWPSSILVASKSNFFLGLVIFLIALGLVSFGVYNAGQIRTTFYDIETKKKALSRPIKLVLISDLHLGAVHSETRLKQIINKVNRLKPDLVCIAGDIFNDDFNAIINPAKARALFRSIQSTYGVFACLGNHDGGKTFDQMTCFLEESHVKLLKDDYVIIDNRMVLFGRVDPSPIGGFGSLRRKNISEMVKSIGLNLPIVVMDHTPSRLERYDNEVDLILSGHTHRGQMFPANWITNRLFLVDYGHYQKNKNAPQVIVTSGVGTWGMPMRIGTKSEVVSIILA